MSGCFFFLIKKGQSLIICPKLGRRKLPKYGRRDFAQNGPKNVKFAIVRVPKTWHCRKGPNFLRLRNLSTPIWWRSGEQKSNMSIRCSPDSLFSEVQHPAGSLFFSKKPQIYHRACYHTAPHCDQKTVLPTWKLPLQTQLRDVAWKSDAHITSTPDIFRLPSVTGSSQHHRVQWTSPWKTTLVVDDMIPNTETK